MIRETVAYITELETTIPGPKELYASPRLSAWIEMLGFNLIRPQHSDVSEKRHLPLVTI